MVYPWINGGSMDLWSIRGFIVRQWINGASMDLCFIHGYMSMVYHGSIVYSLIYPWIQGSRIYSPSRNLWSIHGSMVHSWYYGPWMDLWLCMYLLSIHASKVYAWIFGISMDLWSIHLSQLSRKSTISRTVVDQVGSAGPTRCSGPPLFVSILITICTL